MKRLVVALLTIAVAFPITASAQYDYGYNPAQAMYGAQGGSGYGQSYGYDPSSYNQQYGQNYGGYGNQQQYGGNQYYNYGGYIYADRKTNCR